MDHILQGVLDRCAVDKPQSLWWHRILQPLLFHLHAWRTTMQATGRFPLYPACRVFEFALQVDLTFGKPTTVHDFCRIMQALDAYQLVGSIGVLTSLYAAAFVARSMAPFVQNYMHILHVLQLLKAGVVANTIFAANHIPASAWQVGPNQRTCLTYTCDHWVAIGAFHQWPIIETILRHMSDMSDMDATLEPCVTTGFSQSSKSAELCYLPSAPQNQLVKDQVFAAYSGCAMVHQKNAERTCKDSFNQSPPPASQPESSVCSPQWVWRTQVVPALVAAYNQVVIYRQQVRRYFRTHIAPQLQEMVETWKTAKILGMLHEIQDVTRQHYLRDVVLSECSKVVQERQARRVKQGYFRDQITPELHAKHDAFQMTRLWDALSQLQSVRFQHHFRRVVLPQLVRRVLEQDAHRVLRAKEMRRQCRNQSRKDKRAEIARQREERKQRDEHLVKSNRWFARAMLMLFLARRYMFRTQTKLHVQIKRKLQRMRQRPKEVFYETPDGQETMHMARMHRLMLHQFSMATLPCFHAFLQLDESGMQHVVNFSCNLECLANPAWCQEQYHQPVSMDLFVNSCLELESTKWIDPIVLWMCNNKKLHPYRGLVTVLKHIPKFVQQFRSYLTLLPDVALPEVCSDSLFDVPSLTMAKFVRATRKLSYFWQLTDEDVEHVRETWLRSGGLHWDYFDLLSHIGKARATVPCWYARRGGYCRKTCETN